jgi:hypothetical protein
MGVPPNVHLHQAALAAQSPGAAMAPVPEPPPAVRAMDIVWSLDNPQDRGEHCTAWGQHWQLLMSLLMEEVLPSGEQPEHQGGVGRMLPFGLLPSVVQVTASTTWPAQYSLPLYDKQAVSHSRFLCRWQAWCGAWRARPTRRPTTRSTRTRRITSLPATPESPGGRADCARTLCSKPCFRDGDTCFSGGCIAAQASIGAESSCALCFVRHQPDIRMPCCVVAGKCTAELILTLQLGDIPEQHAGAQLRAAAG